MILAVAELKQLLRLRLLSGRESAGCRHVHTHNIRGKAIDANQTGVQFLFEDCPGTGAVQRVEDVRQAVIVKIEGAHRFAETGGEHGEAFAGPAFEFAQTVVSRGDKSGEPDAYDLAQSKFARPVRMGGEVLVQQGRHLHA